MEEIVAVPVRSLKFTLTIGIFNSKMHFLPSKNYFLTRKIVLLLAATRKTISQ